MKKIAKIILGVVVFLIILSISMVVCAGAVTLIPEFSDMKIFGHLVAGYAVGGVAFSIAFLLANFIFFRRFSDGEKAVCLIGGIVLFIILFSIII